MLKAHVVSSSPREATVNRTVSSGRWDVTTKAREGAPTVFTPAFRTGLKFDVELGTRISSPYISV